MKNPFVPTEEIQKLLDGSYEQFSLRVAEAVEAESAEIFGSEGLTVRVLGTFEDHAIVVTENAQFAKVKFGLSEDNEVVLVGHEKVDVPVYATPEAAEEFARQESARIVESFLSGDIDAVSERVSSLASFLEGSPILADKELVAAYSTRLTEGRTWERHYVMLDALVKDFLAENAIELSVEPKFAMLYEGKISATEHEGFRNLVIKDIASLTTKIDPLTVSIEESIAKLNALIDTNADFASNEDVSVCRESLLDLHADLSETRVLVSEATEKVHSVAALGELFDVLASEFETQEIAGRFFHSHVEKLTV